MTKPSLPQGTRDFGPETVRKRLFIFDTIRAVFECYGFQPLETPAMENLDTLLGKYGDEGDKLIFKILNNGLSDIKNIEKSRLAFEQVLLGKTSKELTERALRYDLTIPFARFVAMNHAQLNFPFKRYQIQPVWRADRPQKGRYREFYQCDADVVGSKSLLNEVELAAIYATAFARLKIPVKIRVNSRKLLAALAECCGGIDKMNLISGAIDKLDKIGLEKVQVELSNAGLSVEQQKIIETYLTIEGENEQKLEAVGKLLSKSTQAAEGIGELQYLLSHKPDNQLPCSVDLTLARGLNYYTGIIYEVNATTVQMGSIGGGGRYDDLTGLFGVPNIPGVGISFGVDRIYDVMEELQLFPDTVHSGTRLLFFNLGDAESAMAFRYMQALRDQGLACELYHEKAKFDKQFKYAEKKNIPFIAILGDKELAEGNIVIKDLRSSEQTTLSKEQLLTRDFSR